MEERLDERVRILCSVNGHEFGVKCIEPCGSGHCISASPDRTIKVWDVRKGKPLSVFQCAKKSSLGKATVCCMKAIDNRTFVVGWTDGQVRVYDAKNGELIKHVGGTTSKRNEVTCIAIDKNSNQDRVCVGYADGLISIIQLRGNDPVFLHAHTDVVTNLLVLDNRLISTAFDGAVRSWDLHTGKQSDDGKPLLQHDKDSKGLLEEIRGDVFATGCSKRPVVYLVQASTGKILHRLTAICTGISVIKLLSPKEVAAGSEDGVVQTWDLEKDKPLHILSGHHSQVKAIEVLKEDVLLTGAQGGDARVWNMVTGECILSFTGFMEEYLQASAVIYPGVWAAGYSDGYLHVWDMRLALNMEGGPMPKPHFTKAWKKKSSQKLLKGYKEHGESRSSWLFAGGDDDEHSGSDASDDDEKRYPMVDAPEEISVWHLRNGGVEEVVLPHELKEVDFIHRSFAVLQQVLYSCIQQASSKGYIGMFSSVPTIPELLAHLTDVGNAYGLASWLYTESSLGKNISSISSEIQYHLEDIKKEYEVTQHQLAVGERCNGRLAVRVFRVTSVLLLSLKKYREKELRSVMSNMSILYETYKFVKHRYNAARTETKSRASSVSTAAHRLSTASFLGRDEARDLRNFADEEPQSTKERRNSVTKHKSFGSFSPRKKETVTSLESSPITNEDLHRTRSMNLY